MSSDPPDEPSLPPNFDDVFRTIRRTILPPLDRDLNHLPAFVANVDGRGYEFWLAHGANYLSSSPGRGWVPVYPEIYRKGHGCLPVNRFRVFGRTMVREVGEGGASPEGRRVFAWAAMSPKEMFLVAYHLRFRAVRRGENPYGQNLPGLAADFVLVGHLLDAVADTPVPGRTVPGEAPSFARAVERLYKINLSRFFETGAISLRVIYEALLLDRKKYTNRSCERVRVAR